MAPQAKVVLAVGSGTHQKTREPQSRKAPPQHSSSSPVKPRRESMNESAPAEANLGQKRQREEFNRFLEESSDNEQAQQAAKAYKRPKRTFEDSPAKPSASEPEEDAKSGSEENWLPGAQLKLNKE